MLDATHPTEYDAVLGNQVSVPVGAAILGGLSGVRSRLASPHLEAKIAVISEASQYGDVGFDLIVQLLQDKRGGIGRTPHLMCNWYSDSTAGLTRLQAKLLKLWQSRFAPSKNLDNIVQIKFAVVTAICRRKFKHRGNKIRSIE